jgi:hypothetical protein
MKVRNCLTVLIVVLAAIAAMSQDDLQQKYAGKSKCLPELKSATEHYGIRLDKSQNAYLAAFKLKDRKILTIVQLKDTSDRCGVIRDVVQAQDVDSSFVWQCRDKKTPSDVVVGTWPAKHPKTSGPAVEAWRIDLTQMKFAPVQGVPVSCAAGYYAGSDEGDDLASWAKKQAARHAVQESK